MAIRASPIACSRRRGFFSRMTEIACQACQYFSGINIYFKTFYPEIAKRFIELLGMLSL